MLFSLSWLALAVAVTALPHKETHKRSAVNTSTLSGKYLLGYQGWFRKPGPGVNNHWTGTGGSVPGPGNVDVDFIPDVSQYPANCLFETDFTLPGGGKAQFYDNTCEGVVDLHFKQMQAAGVDGVLVQRFLGYQNDPTFTTVQAAAEKYGLGFVVEYDISGGNSATASVTNEVLADYNSLIKQYTSSPAYIHEKGKPVVFVFGVGYTNFKISTSDAQNLINGLKSDGAYVGIAPPVQWAQAVSANTAWAPVLKSANCISPWQVGAYSYSNYASFFKTQQSDMKLATSLGIDYAPVVWPGGSSCHLNGGYNPSQLNSYPRYNGSFFENQVNSVLTLKPKFIFNAMFDEYNEGTAMNVALRVDQLPTNDLFAGIDNTFATTHYLTLAGTAASQLHAQQ